jgi:hypothetical protein
MGEVEEMGMKLIVSIRTINFSIHLGYMRNKVEMKIVWKVIMIYFKANNLYMMIFYKVKKYVNQEGVCYVVW